MTVTEPGLGTELRRWVDARRDEMAEFLGAYIRQRSVNPGRATGDDATSGEADAQRWLAHQVENFGLGRPDIWEVSADRPNLAWTIGSPSDLGIVFNGHADTVGVSAAQRSEWDGDPFGGEVRDGRVIGRGAADMKGGTVAFLWAARALQELGVPLRRRAAFTVTVAEETAECELGILSLLGRGYQAPVFVCAEPTDLRLCPAGMGITYFRVTVQGKSAHVASRAGAMLALAAFEASEAETVIGVDAITLMAALLEGLRALDDRWQARPGHPLLPAGVGRAVCPIRIGGGNSRAEIADECSAEFAVSFDPADDVDAAMREVQAAIDEVAARSRWLRAHPPKVETPIVHRLLAPLLLDLADEPVRRLSHPLAERQGPAVPLGAMPGPCDANVLAVAGQRAVIFGPGRLGDGAHGSNEFVSADDLAAACWIDACMIAELCG
jgi:acetylornithine deacetylase/succinyl-diaminopimelate desuccinylase-like protein